jgi:hypothetical protein
VESSRAKLLKDAPIPRTIQTVGRMLPMPVLGVLHPAVGRGRRFHCHPENSFNALDSFSINVSRRISRRSRSGSQASHDEFLPSAFRTICIREEIEVGGRDHSLCGESLKIYNAGPIRFINEDDRNWGHLVSLNQSKQFE